MSLPSEKYDDTVNVNDSESCSDDDSDENDEYLKMIQFRSIRNSDHLEEAISVSWEGISPLNISTLLEPEDLAPLFAGAQWAGTRVWHAAICAVKYLQDQYSQQLKNGDSLLELGCGLGVPGMIAHAALGAQNVCLTDQDSIMSQLFKNIETNFPDTKETQIKALPLNWSRDGIHDLLEKTGQRDSGFDIVLNCDCVYEPLYGKSWELLVEVMEECLRINPNTIMLTSVERRNFDGIDEFVQKLQDSPHVSNVEKVFSDVPYKIEIYLARGVQ